MAGIQGTGEDHQHRLDSILLTNAVAARSISVVPGSRDPEIVAEVKVKLKDTCKYTVNSIPALAFLRNRCASFGHSCGPSVLAVTFVEPTQRQEGRWRTSITAIRIRYQGNPAHLILQRVDI